MKLFQMLLVSLLCAACTSMHSIAPGQVYSSPIGGVTCQTDPHFKTKVDEVFGPHGGTVHLISELGVTRIDIVEFSPVVPSSILSGSQLNEFHGKYLAESLMPLIRSGVPNASLLGQSVNEVNGRHIHLSAVLLPGKSNFMYPDGKYADGIRVQAQYTNGQFMYVISHMDYVRPNATADSQLKTNYAYVTKTFSACSFPG